MIPIFYIIFHELSNFFCNLVKYLYSLCKNGKDALISKDDRIHNAIVKTKANHPELSKIQLGWLDRIEAQLLKEVVLNRETFDSDAFKNKGGYNAVNKAFGQKLDEFIDEINGYMYSA